jgi:hypothetical protein
MSNIYIITSAIFMFILVINYFGAVGRIEKRNQLTGFKENLGPTSQKEDEAFLKGNHKKIAFKQALIGSIIWSLIAFGLMYFFI